MISVVDTILKLTKQFYPTGRAYKMAEGGVLYRIHKGLAHSEARALADAKSILNSLLPDNSGFTTNDSTDWERRLGMITNSDVDQEDRKLAIKRKMAAPGRNPAKEHYLYLQSQLRAAGFNVYVYENRFTDYPEGYFTQNPLTVTSGIGAVKSRHGMFRHGQRQHGSQYGNIIANHIDESMDADFSVGSNLRSTFFIGGSSLGVFANVDVQRKAEFRQLILRLKPVQTVGFLLINYI